MGWNALGWNVSGFPVFSKRNLQPLFHGRHDDSTGQILTTFNPHRRKLCVLALFVTQKPRIVRMIVLVIERAFVFANIPAWLGHDVVVLLDNADKAAVQMVFLRVNHDFERRNASRKVTGIHAFLVKLGVQAAQPVDFQVAAQRKERVDPAVDVVVGTIAALPHLVVDHVVPELLVDLALARQDQLVQHEL